MGLIVLALRCYLVFQNIYVTFKTLKRPPPSSRNNGQPSVRAMTQRKRDMKGCMAIWIVWCCFATYEAVVERLISIFIPFYDEIKSVVLVFFILARARGAEPIYLHVIRPLLKPYVSTLDAVLDIIHDVGDFVLLIVSLPFQPLLSWWNGRTGDDGEMTETEVDDAEGAHHQVNHPASRYPLNPVNSKSVSNPRHGQAYNLDPRLAPAQYAVAPDSKKANLDDAISRFYASPKPVPPPAHELWHPPPSAYDDPPDYDSHLPPGPPISMPESVIPSLGTPELDGFRIYPPFPSAYPPTPIASTGVPVPQAQRGSIYPSIPEHEGVPSSSNDDRQGFGQSLLLPREPANPGSVGGLSDDIQVFGVQDNNNRCPVSDDSYNNQDGYETEEDSFDVTLRTPFRLRTRRAESVIRAQSGTSTATAATDVSSALSDTTGLSTVGHASSLRTRTSSQTTSIQATDSSVAGKKRPFPRSVRIPRPAMSTTPKTPRRRDRRTGTGSSHRVFVISPLLQAQRKVKDGIVDRDNARSDSDESSLAPKRRRVGTPSRRSGATRVLPTVRIRTTEAGNGKRDVRSGTTAKATIAQTDSLPITTRASLRVAKARAAPTSSSHLPRASKQASFGVGDVGHRLRPGRRGTGNKRIGEGRQAA